MRKKATPKSWTEMTEQVVRKAGKAKTASEGPAESTAGASSSKAESEVSGPKSGPRRSGRTVAGSPRVPRKEVKTSREETKAGRPSRAAKTAAKVMVASEKAKAITGPTKREKVNAKVSSDVGSKKVDVNSLDDLLPNIFAWVTEPKETSMEMIKKYIEKYIKYYPGLHVDGNSLEQALTRGVDNAQLYRVKGTGSAADAFQLVDEADKTGNRFEDAIEDAVIAMTEPKEASIKAIRIYLSEYHLEYNIAHDPKVLLRSLERCVTKGKIARLSGVGLSGSFRLSEPYHPSPRELWGEWYEGTFDGDEASQADEDVEMSDESEESDASEKNEDKKIEVATKTGRKRGRPQKPKPLKKSVTTVSCAKTKYSR